MSGGDYSLAFNEAYNPVFQDTDPLGRPVWQACIDPQNYSYTRSPSTYRHSPLRGRPRFVLKDTRQTFEVTATMQLTQSEFQEWQTYWVAVAERGAKPFPMRLRLDSVLIFTFLSEVYEVTALEPWTATYTDARFWRVSLKLSAPWTLGFLATLCDVIDANPINALPANDIYGGPIDNLATDIIEPCEAVLG